MRHWSPDRRLRFVLHFAVEGVPGGATPPKHRRRDQAEADDAPGVDPPHPRRPPVVELEVHPEQYRTARDVTEHSAPVEQLVPAEGRLAVIVPPEGVPERYALARSTHEGKVG